MSHNLFITDEQRTNLEALFAEVKWIRQCLESKLKGKSYPVYTLNINNSAITLQTLCRKFHLSNFDRNILLLTVGMAVDPTFAQLCAKVQGNPQLNYPTFSLALTALPSANWSILSAENPLKIWQLIEVQEGLTATPPPLKLIKESFVIY
jgi:hypothetical protein